MKTNSYILGIEGGGTKTTWVFLNEKLESVANGEAGHGNWHHLGKNGLMSLLKQIRSALPHDPTSIGICLAGVHLDSDKKEVKKIAQTIWPRANRIVPGEDTKSGYYAAHGKEDGILVIAGTGSNTVGRKGDLWEKSGGWGFILGDQGSAYHIAHEALRASYTTYDEIQKTTPLAQALLRFAGCNSLPELVSNVYAHGKDYVASFAKIVLDHAQAGDKSARQIVQKATESLAEHVSHIQRRMKLKNPPVGLVGGLFNSPLYLQLFKQAVFKYFKPKDIFVAKTPGAIGAALFAIDASPEDLASTISISKKQPEKEKLPDISKLPTEKRNPRSMNLHKLNVKELVHLFIEEEKYVQRALKESYLSIVKACELVSKALQKNGRLFYVGAGTSGRLGVLDASEMPPTFGLSPDIIQAIIAGGTEALFRAQEGAEDKALAGAQSIRERGITKKDIVWGITTSGRTPFVMGALEEARKIGASTVLLTCNPAWKHPSLKPTVAIHLNVGPELITGSTRLKGGTVTKLVLNMASSIAMIRGGRVYENLMIHVAATNEKLRARACGLVQTLTSCDTSTALQALETHQWEIVPTVEALKFSRTKSKKTKKRV